jgi:hypothetical protein
MNDGAFDELGGNNPEQDQTDAWDVGGAIYEPCPSCGVKADERCRNSITGKESHVPCVARLVGGGDAA